MTSRKEAILQKADDLFRMMMDIVCIMHDLEELGCKAQANKLDSITGRLENISNELSDKATK